MTSSTLSPPPFDLTILTARDPAQQWLFERRLAQSPLREWTRQTLVVADPPGSPPGSGGSTIYALSAALDQLGIRIPEGEPDTSALAEQLDRFRILLVHCGGLSQRLPQFASLGKAFAPISQESGDEYLLAAVVRSLAALCAGARSGVVVACGDVLFRGSSSAPFPVSDAVGWAWPAPLEQASRHGVYLWDLASGKATRALQKPHVAQLRDLGFRSRAPLDTGVAHVSAPVVADLLATALQADGATFQDRVLAGPERWRGLDLYGDLLPALVPGHDDTTRRENPCLEALKRHSLQVLCPEDGEFLHFGTTAELLRILHLDGPPAPLLLQSAVEDGALMAGAGSVVHFCHVESPLVVGNGSYVLGFHTRCGQAVVDDHRLAYQSPLLGEGAFRRALVVLGVGDDPKRGPDALLMGEELVSWAQRRGLSTAELWAEDLPMDDRTLWNARLFPTVTPHLLPFALDWLQGRQAVGKRWDETPLLSLAEVHERFDASHWWKYEARLRRHLQAEALASSLRQDPELSAAVLAAEIAPEHRAILRNELRLRAARDKDPLLSARIFRLCAMLAEEKEPVGPFHQRAFAAIRRGITSRSEPPVEISWQAPPSYQVTVTAPVRVDLAGGWTDTPPQACELGGAVLNMALHLNGRLPVRATSQVLAEPVLHLVSHDLGLECRIVAPEELRDCRRPGDPFAIHKAALLECGIGGTDGADLARRLLAAGGGLRLETTSGVPKGSGLGTSSILGAVVLASLRHLSGQVTSWESLFQAVLALEQRMTTGGGWQDQIGGMLPKIKLTVTDPGLAQVPRVTHVDCTQSVERELEERLVLFYTGVPRLARNVLQRVVSRYLAREPDVRPALRRMKDLAHEVTGALRAGDFVRLGAGLRESWELKCLLEPTATHGEIEGILRKAAPYCLGWKLAGAGGGGFLLLLARSGDDARRLCDLLPLWQPEGKVFQTGLSPVGLTITGETCPASGRLIG